MLKRFLILIMTVGLVTSVPILAGGDERTYTGENGIWDGCNCSAEFLQSGTRCLIACPQGDGQTLADGNNEIVLVVRDFTGLPIPNIIPFDIWLYFKVHDRAGRWRRKPLFCMDVFSRSIGGCIPPRWYQVPLVCLFSERFRSSA